MLLMTDEPRWSPAAIRQDFARRLQNKLNDKGWTQAELARRMAPLLKDSRVGRDNVSKWVRGIVLPLPPYLEAMAKVLGVESKELLPWGRPNATRADDEQQPKFHLLENGRVWVEINHFSRELPYETAVTLIGIVKGVERPLQP